MGIWDQISSSVMLYKAICFLASEFFKLFFYTLSFGLRDLSIFSLLLPSWGFTEEEKIDANYV